MQATVLLPTPVARATAPCARPVQARRQPFVAARRGLQRQLVRAAAEEATAATTSASGAAASSGNFIPVIRPEELPKGTKREARVEGKRVLLFWYRNQIYAIEARSPAEGAYSEGFANAKFTQDYCIECPSTGSLFSLKDGSVVSWYPNNPVLRMLTPQDTCRNLEIYPVKLTQDAILVDVSNSSQGVQVTRGGADTSLENNNVYGLEPKMYLAGDEASNTNSSNTVAFAATLAVGAVAIVGTAAAAYWFVVQP